MGMSIVIADDHPLILKGLNDFLIEKNFNVLDSVTNGQDAFKSIVKHNPDVAILDINMPMKNGLEVAKACRDNQINTKIVLITFERDASLLARGKDIGINGYILKEFALAEIEHCLDAVSKDEDYFSPNLTDHLVEDNRPDLSVLSPAEINIIRSVAMNKTTKEIAEDLFISFRTVEKHRSNIIKKLGLPKHQNALLIWAKENQDHFI